MPTSREQVKSIFGRAIEIQTEVERARFLEEACGQDPALRAEVEGLLGAMARAGNFLGQPSADVDVTAAKPTPEKPGMVIGPFRLLQEIGEGGMGTVYMAEQSEPVRRRVALKIIKPGMDSRAVVARFEAERQALALMDHPNIAKVLDAGATESGRPYFVMELVKGLPITQFCDERHLSLRERLELFASVCQAVQHAHQKGIIHRDLKPSNVLIALYDGVPVPKVIDFGVAKATGAKLTDKTLYTEFGQVVGTLQYMSPEQAEASQLDVDTRSDIYSLGVLLYELLTGSTPLERRRMKEAALFEVLRLIREEEPPRPSTRLSTCEGRASIAANRGLEPKKLSGLVRGELDWIVMKALEKDRNRRYETANGFAMDVQRYLADEHVLACPPSAGYRFRKFARRNKVAFATTAIVALALLVGSGVSTWQAIRATYAEGLAAARLKTETEAKGKAIASQAAAEKARQAEAAQRKIAEQREAEADKERKEAEKQRKDADEQRQAAEKNRKEAEHQSTIATANETRAKEQESLARRRFYAAQMNLARQAWEAGQPARLLELLESQRPKFDEEDLRGFDWYYLWRLCHQNLHRTLSGPAGEVVYAVAITSDGKTLVSGSTDACVRVWDVATWKERAVLTGHRSAIWRLSVSPNGKLAASASMDHTVKLWDLEKCELLETFAGRHQMARSVAFSPDGKTLAVGTEDGMLELWDVETRKRRLSLLAQSAPTIGLDYSPDGKYLVTGAGWDTVRGQGGVKVWDVSSETPKVLYSAANSMFASFSPDSSRLAISGNVLDAASGERQVSINTPSAEAVVFSVDSSTLIVGDRNRAVTMSELVGGATRTVGVHQSAVYSVACFPAGKLLASGGADGVVKVWNTDPAPDAIIYRHNSAIRSIAFAPDSKHLIVGSDTAGRVLSAETGQETAALPDRRVLASTADGSLLAAWAPDDKRVIWDVAAARERAVLPVGPEFAGCAFSRDGRLLVTWNKSNEAPERSVRIWDLATSRVRATLKLTAFGSIIHAAFSPDGRTVATAHQFGTITLWDAATGQQRKTLWREESKLLAAHVVAFSHNGRLVAAANHEGILRLWNVETGQLQTTFKGHTESVRTLAFSPDDKRLLSGSTDKTARLWDNATGQELLTLQGHKHAVHLVAFAPDGKRLATASHNEVKLCLAATQPEAAAFRVELDPDDPDSPRAANDLGDRLLETQQPQEAEKAYAKGRARLETLVAALGDAQDYRDELAYNQIATSLLTDPPPAGAQSPAQIADIWRALPADRQVRLAMRLTGRCYALRTAGRLPEAQRVAEQLTVLTPDASWPWHQLGYILDRSNQSEKAIDAYTRSIELDPTNAPSWNNRGVIYQKLRQPEKATADYRQAITLNPSNSVLVTNLATDLRRQGKLDDAVAILCQGLEALGADDPDALKIRVQLAEIYALQRNWPEQIGQLEHILDQRIKTLGKEDAETLSSMNMLAVAYWNNKQLDQSIPLFEETVRLNRAHRPPNHPDTYQSIANLAVNYREAGRLTEALPLLEEVVEWVRKRPAPFASRFAWVSAALGGIYEANHEYDKAEPLVRDLLTLREKTEPEIWTTFNAKSLLGGCLRGQKKFAEAEPLLLQGYEGMKEREDTIPPIGKVRLTEALERLVELYEAWNKSEEAAKWRKALEKNTHLESSDPLLWIERGRSYAQRGKHEKARADFAQALKLDPAHTLGRFELSKQNSNVCAAWDFSQGVCGWTAAASIARLTTSDGALIMEGIGRDPLFTCNVVAPAGRKVLMICARVPSAMDCQIFWQSKTAESFTEEKSVRFQLPGSDGKWLEHPVPFEAEADLVGLRFDLPDEGESKLEVAWMILADDSPRKSGEATTEK